MAPGAIDTTDNPTNRTFSQHVPSNQIPALFSLRNKTIAITGGGRGLGLTLAFAVVEAGGHAALLDLLPEPSEPEYSALTKLAKQSGLTVSYRKCDVTSEADVTSVLDTIEESGSKLGAPFSGMIACAGIQQRVPALDYSSSDFERILRVNVVGGFISVKHTARILQRNGRHGSIVLIASMSGQIANRGLTCTAYNSSKSAVQQMCRSLAQEWGQYGIRVNTLSPGYIRTAMTDELLAADPGLEETWMRGALLGKLGVPDDFKAPAVPACRWKWFHDGRGSESRWRALCVCMSRRYRSNLQRPLAVRVEVSEIWEAGRV